MSHDFSDLGQQGLMQEVDFVQEDESTLSYCFYLVGNQPQAQQTLGYVERTQTKGSPRAHTQKENPCKQVATRPSRNTKMLLSLFFEEVSGKAIPKRSSYVVQEEQLIRRKSLPKSAAAT